MKCRRCNTTTNPNGVCPHCGWSASGTNGSRGGQPAPGDSGPVNLALAQVPLAIELVDEEPEPTPNAEAEPFCLNTASLERHLISHGLASGLSQIPERIEAGLRAVTEHWGPAANGARSTEGARIDRLFRDRRGAWVIVAFAGEAHEVDWVQELRSRMDWVRDHRAHAGEPVRAIVLVPAGEPLPDASAIGLGHALTLKTWQLVVSIEDRER